MNTPALTLAAAAAALTSTAVVAQASDPVVAIVRVPKPWYAPRGSVVKKMIEAKPTYAALDGLRFKAYSFERESGDYGGLYFWRDRAAAEAWFNPAWFERVRRERGVDGQVRLFEAPLTLDNEPGPQPGDASEGVATLVEVPIPAGLTPEKLRAGFAAALPTYRTVPGLLRKHFTYNATHFGGVYLWRDEASAQAWFNEAWHARVKATYGAPGRIEWFSTPILQQP